MYYTVPTVFTFSFVNAQGQTVDGSFNVNVNDVSVIAGGLVPVTGNITAAAQNGGTPKPAAMVLLGMGLPGLEPQPVAKGGATETKTVTAPRETEKATRKGVIPRVTSRLVQNFQVGTQPGRRGIARKSVPC